MPADHTLLLNKVTIMAQKMSIFAQRMKMQREEKLKIEKSNHKTGDISKSFGNKSFILAGTESNEIHEENIRKLSSLSESQILEEREKLLSTLNPSLVEFIKNKRKTSDNKSEDSTSSASVAATTQENEPIETKSLGSTSEPMDISEGPRVATDDDAVQIQVRDLANKYPHMDVVEKEKLQWIGDLPIEIKPPSDPYPARFNFEGDLLPYADEGEGVLQGLHNHGEEPERPGYTLQELIQLSRSSVLQQRVISLNTLSKIMAKASHYDECFNEPILPALLEADMFLLLRFSLDDPAPPIVMAAASALGNLIVNHVDEVCLDTLLGTPLGVQQPSLGVVLDMKQSDIDELKDPQLLKLDLIRGAIRTDILQRIKYVLTNLKPEPVEVKQLLKALTRIARHSFEMANSVFTFPGLLEAVRTILDVKEGSSYYPEGLKLFRIIASRSHTLAANIYDKFNIINLIFKFIAMEKAVGHPEAMHLVLESFYSWQSFLSYNIATDTIGSLSPVLMRLVETHLGLTNIDSSRLDLEHATALVSTLSVVAKLNFSQVRHVLPSVLEATTKWLSQYNNVSHNKFSSCKLLGACFGIFAATFDDFDSSRVLLLLLEKFFAKSNFTNIVKKLRGNSWLIHGEIISSPENLPCLGSVPPTVNDESSLPFVYGVASYLLASNSKPLMELFLNNNEVIKYVKTILRDDNISKLCRHWYARQELYFLVVVVHMFTAVDIKEHQSIFHKLAFSLLTSVQVGDKFLLPQIVSKTIFNSKYFCLDVESVVDKLNELKLVSTSDCPKVNQTRYKHLEESLNKLDDIERVYIRELGLEGLRAAWPPVTLTGVLNSTQSALPLDWPFLPILRLHAREGNDKGAVSIVSLSIQWFIILEELLPEVFSLNYTAKYCRLCCIYLTGNDLFQDVSPFMETALFYILSHKKDLNFEKDVPGLNSFYDFYRELLEQFAGVSYGNTVFGEYILLPLQQRHSHRFKKLIWSELAAVLRLLRTPIEQVDMRDYLEPQETDADLLITYLRAVGTGKIREHWCPVLYKVAIHHVASYVKNNSDKVSSSLLSMINSLGNQELKTYLLSYCSTV